MTVNHAGARGNCVHFLLKVSAESNRYSMKRFSAGSNSVYHFSVVDFGATLSLRAQVLLAQSARFF